MTEIPFPSVSICHPLWTWPNMANLVDLIDTDGTTTKHHAVLMWHNLYVNAFYNMEALAIERDGYLFKNYTTITELTQANLPGNAYKEVFYLLHYIIFNALGNDTYTNSMDAFRLERYDKFHTMMNVSPYLNPLNASHILEFCKACNSVPLPVFGEWLILTEDVSKETFRSKDKVYTELCPKSTGGKEELIHVQKWCESCWHPFEQKDCLVTILTKHIKATFIKAYAHAEKFPRKSILIDKILSLAAPADKRDVLVDYFKDLEAKTGTNPYSIWSHLNHVYLSDYFKGLSEPGTYKTDQIFFGSELLSPKIHGNYENDHILVPFCSFGTKEMTKCTAFKRAERIYLRHQICYTYESEELESMNSIEPDAGFNFVVNQRLPRRLGLEPPSVVIHPRGTIPDLNSFPSSIRKISPNTIIKIGVEATLTNVTKNFEKLNKSQRRCALQNPTKNFYSDVNCKMEKRLEIAHSTCHCFPWFIAGYDNQSVCMGDQLKCFNDLMINTKINSSICPKPCVSEEHSITSEIIEVNMETKERIKSYYGPDLKNYLSEAIEMFYPELDMLSNPTKLMSRTAIVQINFMKSRVNYILKDAKVTFADMLGNIGGTFGVFLGLSIVGILDFLIIIWSWVNQIIRKPST